MRDVNLDKIYQQLHQFYLQKNSAAVVNRLEAISGAQKEIHSLFIDKVVDDGEAISIYLGRPGLIIGRHGSNIENLQKFFDREIKIFESISPAFELWCISDHCRDSFIDLSSDDDNETNYG